VGGAGGIIPDNTFERRTAASELATAATTYAAVAAVARDPEAATQNDQTVETMQRRT
jgi:hypothetical protein